MNDGCNINKLEKKRLKNNMRKTGKSLAPEIHKTLKVRVLPHEW